MENHNLSPREQQLITLATAGLTDVAIAHELGISEATVATYWGRIRIKLGPCSRAELVAISLRETYKEEIEGVRQQCGTLVDSLKFHGASGCTIEYQKLFECAPDAIMVVAADASIEYANPAGHSLFGYQPGELAGRSLTCLVPDRLVEVHRSHFKEYVKRPERRAEVVHMESPAKRKDGSEVLISTDLSSFESKNGLIIMAMIRQEADSVPPVDHFEELKTLARLSVKV